MFTDVTVLVLARLTYIFSTNIPPPGSMLCALDAPNILSNIRSGRFAWSENSN